MSNNQIFFNILYRIVYLSEDLKSVHSIPTIIRTLVNEFENNFTDCQRAVDLAQELNEDEVTIRYGIEVKIISVQKLY